MTAWLYARWTPLAALFVVAAIVAGAQWVSGVPGSPPRDSLGRQQGEAVGDYLDRARTSLDGPDLGAPRWALVSMRQRLTPAMVPDVVSGVRVSLVIFHVPAERVQTALLWQATPAGAAALRSSAGYAARTAFTNLSKRSAGTERSRQVARFTALRLAQDCACTAGMIVRAPLGALRSLAGRAEVRAVEALPDGSEWLSVNPLLPEQEGTPVPEPDDGPVPPA